MEPKKITCAKARDLSIFNVLTSMGFDVKKNREKEAWFLSPFREEKIPSFKVSKTLNRWYDHGEGVGGNTLDFVIKYHNFTVKEALEFLGGSIDPLSFQQPFKNPVNKKDDPKDHINIKNTRTLQNIALIDYLEYRKINVKLAKKFCQEVYYYYNDKIYFSIGLENVSGGWELRNKFFKNSSSPKDFTYFESGQKNLIVVEGMFDFFSLITIFPERLDDSDFIILNSLSFKDNITPLFLNYENVLLFLDSDPSGRKTTGFFKSISNKCIDKSSFYKDFEDINDWLVNKED